MPHTYFVYILANEQRGLYIGVTRDLHRRLDQHRHGSGSAFVKRTRALRLVHVETASRAIDAIRREKQLKGWRRIRKLAVIEAGNPDWDDLGPRWGLLERADEPSP